MSYCPWTSTSCAAISESAASVTILPFDARDTFSGCVKIAGENEIFIRIFEHVAEIRGDEGAFAVRKRKDELNDSFITAVSHIGSASASAESCTDGGDDDRFSRARLTGYDIESFLKIQIHLPDNSKISDIDV